MVGYLLEHVETSNTLLTFEHGGRPMMVQFCFARDTVGPIFKVMSDVTRAKYYNLLSGPLFNRLHKLLVSHLGNY